MAARSSEGTALVTAAGGAIGRAVAAALAPRWSLVLQESPDCSAGAEEWAASLRRKGGAIALVLADLRDVAATAKIFAGAGPGPVTLLVNAATLFESDCKGFDGAAWERMLAVNLRAPWQLAAGFAAALPAEANGAIVNVLDSRLWQTSPGAHLYELTQAALAAATETMARAYAPRIRVNSVGPPKAIAAAATLAARSGLPLVGTGAPNAIAKAVLYLAGAANVTGQKIAIDPDAS